MSDGQNESIMIPFRSPPGAFMFSGAADSSQTEKKTSFSREDSGSKPQLHFRDDEGNHRKVG